MTVLLFILILGVLVFVHELGHFAVARWSGVAVEEFGFGFPPRIVGLKRGSTTYSINWVPFGGFVRLQGEQDDGEKRPDSFVQAPFRKQFAILIAGVFMNALLAWALLSATFAVGVSADPAAVPQNRHLQLSASRVEAIVTDGSPAALAGLTTGDVVNGVNGQPLTTTDQIISLAQAENFPVLQLTVMHKGQSRTVSVTPRPSGASPRYGLGIQQVVTIRYPWYIAPWYGLQSAGDMTKETIIGFGRLIRDLVTTAKVSSDITGPVGIAVLTGQVAQYGFIATLQFMAILSISLAVVNVLPLPALDGGRALFVFLGRVRGRPVNPRIEGTIHAVGFYTLLLLIVLLSIRDVSKFQIIDQLKSLFQ